VERRSQRIVIGVKLVSCATLAQGSPTPFKWAPVSAQGSLIAQLPNLAARVASKPPDLPIQFPWPTFETRRKWTARALSIIGAVIMAKSWRRPPCQWGRARAKAEAHLILRLAASARGSNNNMIAIIMGPSGAKIR